MPFTSIAETLAHPSYATAVWNLDPHREGFAPVAAGCGGPLNLYWQIHGEGPIKVVFVPGLGFAHTSWQRQVRFLGHDRAGRFSVLCFDNRGLGRSDKPLARYTTSQMALDVADLVDHVGWTGDRAVHVVGISMGGMIAQELAAHVPARVASLTLVSTAAAAENVGAWHEMIGKRLTMLMPKSLAGNIEFTARQCFTQQWLDSPDDGDVPSPATTPRCKPSPAPGGEYGTFATNFQRFQALELHKRRDPGTWSNAGFACQLMAGATHKKTAEQLREIAERVGRDRIAVVHGTGDQIFDPGLARKLIDAMGPGEVQIIEGAGHAPVFENAAWFNPWLEGWLERVHGGSPS